MLQCAAVYHIIEHFIALHPPHLFCWVPVSSLGASESYCASPSLLSRQAKTSDFISKIARLWIFLAIQAAFVAGKSLCDMEIHS